VEQYLHSNCLPPWHRVGQFYFIFTTYLFTYLSRSHNISGPIKEPFLYITYPLHAHYMTHLFHFHWTNYINIMKSYNNKPHYITLWPSDINTLCTLDILLITFTSKFLKTRHSFNVKRHISNPYRWKECLIYWWMKHYMASGTSHASHKLRYPFLKNCSKYILWVKYLFHKYALRQGHAILDIAYTKYV
jgi:hypothetical protein